MALTANSGISIDTVYQRVLALANKEQRGYITPQEFNLFANLAQSEIVEQYFYDHSKIVNQSPNDTEYSDVSNLLEEKIAYLEVERNNVYIKTYFDTQFNDITIDDEVYRLGDVRIGITPVEMLTSREFDQAMISPLTAPTLSRPIGKMYNIIDPITGSHNNNAFSVAIGQNLFAMPNSHDINVSYIRKPNLVQWGYIIVNDKAMYDHMSTRDFEIHPSEEVELVYKILKFVGISSRRQDLMSAGQGMEIQQIQQEKQ